MFSSASEAYESALQDLHRQTGVGMLDLSEGDGSDTSGDSTTTEDEVIASTMASSLQRRSVEAGDQRNVQSTTAMFVGQDDAIAEGQVWDRMVNDLAIGAGVSGAPHNYSMQNEGNIFSHQRGISGGIAASMLALSAAIPRPESQWSSSGSSRMLPHPIWARRYPGAAGEWLRSELARRASSSQSTSPAATSIPRAAAHVSRWVTGRNATTTQRDASSAQTTSRIQAGTPPASNPFNDLFSDPQLWNRGNVRRDNWTASHDWSVLRFPPVDPLTDEAGNEPSSEIVAGGEAMAATGSTLAVPLNNSALVPTPPPAEEPVQEELVRQEVTAPLGATDREEGEPATTAPLRDNAHSTEAADIVAQMAQRLREMDVARSTAPATTDERVQDSTGRATRGGMSYIRRLRQLDGLEPPTDRRSVAELDDGAEPHSPPRPYEVFPWYQPPHAVEGGRRDDDKDGDEAVQYLRRVAGESEVQFDPDGANLSWYQMARERMELQSALDSTVINDDPNGERLEAGGDEQGHPTTSVRRRAITGNASQRARNRSALVMADQSNEPAIAADIEGSAQPGSQAWSPTEGWTLIDQRPMSPVRRSRDEGSESVTTWLREPAHPSGRFSTSPRPINDAELDTPMTTRTVHTYRPVPVSDDPRTTRRPRRLASLVDSDVQSYVLFDGENARVAREGTPSPELMPTDVARRGVGNNGEHGVLGRARQLTSIGRRLEEEFRARQGELRQREERLRLEVARRRLELDQVRRRQGRIGRVVDRSRRFSGLGDGEQVGESEVTAIRASNIDDTTDAFAEMTPLLGEESSLIRRRALREPRPPRLREAAIGSHEERYRGSDEAFRRAAPPTPLQELMARISLNSSRMQAEAERRLRRTSSWSAAPAPIPGQGFRFEVTSFDDQTGSLPPSLRGLPTGPIRNSGQERPDADSADCLPTHTR